MKIIIMIVIILAACTIGRADDKTKKIITHFSHIWTAETKGGPSVEINKALMILATHTMKDGVLYTKVLGIDNVRVDKTRKGTIIIDLVGTITFAEMLDGKKPKIIRGDVYLTLTDKKTLLFDNKKYKRK